MLQLLFGDLVHRAAKSQKVKAEWVHPSELFTTISNSRIFQPEIITIPQDETYGAGHPFQPKANELNRPGEPWRNFPPGTKAIRFLDEDFFKHELYRPLVTDAELRARDEALPDDDDDDE